MPKVHNLRVLAASLPVPTAELDSGDLDLLNPWITAGRYPGNLRDAARDEAEELCLAAGRVLEVVKRLLDTAPP